MIVSRIDFAGLANVTSGNLTTYIKRSKVILEPDGKSVDTSRIENKSFLESRSHSGKAPVYKAMTTKKETKPKPVPIVHVEEKKETKIIHEQPIIENREPVKSLASEKTKTKEPIVNSKWQIDLEKAKADLEKKNIDIELAKQKLTTLLGNNLPIDFVKEVITQLSKSMINNYKSYTEQHISEICHKFRISDKDKAVLIQENVTRLNKFHDKAVSDAMQKMKSVIGKSRTKVAESDELDD